jgi:CRISPR type III-A-associated protein Csm2
MPYAEEDEMSDKGKTYKSFAEMGPPRQAGQQGSGSGGRGGYSSAPPGLPKDYLPRRFFDKENHLLGEIFIKWPQEITDALAMARPKATKNALRAFYTMLRMAKNQFDAQRGSPDIAWGDAKNQLYKLRTAAQYQSTRQVISRLCQEFLNANIDAVLQEGKDPALFGRYFNAFVEHFQAVMAYLPERADR